MSELHVRDLVVRFDDVIAVDRVSFRVAEGEFVSLLGPSGCGKTTILRCIAGLESPVSGEIRIGTDVVVRGGLRATPPHKRRVNMVFQSYAIWPHMTVFDNVAYGPRAHRQTAREVDKRVTEALRVAGLEAIAGRYGSELSGGQQQRVAVARAMVTEPKLMLYDEPLSNLDAGLREQLRFELMTLQRRVGRTSLYVTHDQAEAMLMSDRIVLMNAGRIVQESTPRVLYERPLNRFAASFVGNANLLSAKLVEGHADGSYTVRLEGGLELRGRPSVPSWRPRRDGGALVCIRPENIVPTEDGFPARVYRAGYLGAVQSCEIQVGPLALRADIPARVRVEEGTRLTLRIDPDCVVLVPDG